MGSGQWTMAPQVFNRVVTTATTTHLPEQAETVHMITQLRQEALSGSGNGQRFISWRTPSFSLKSDTRGILQIKSWPMTVLHFLRKAFSSLYL